MKQRQEDAVTRRKVWAAIVERLGGWIGVLAAFAVGYTLLVWLGYQFKESDRQLTIMWPSAGLLFMVLWLSPLRWWPAFIAIQIAVELSVGGAIAGHFNPSPALAPVFALANSIDGLVGATVMRLLLRPGAVVKVLHVLKFLLATVIGSAASALLGAYAATLSYTPLSYAQHLQIWLGGNWLGSLAIVPVVYGWVVPIRDLYPELRLKSRIELVLLTIAVALCTSYVFAATPGGAISVLQLPVILAALLVLAAFRLPPRWVTTLVVDGSVDRCGIGRRCRPGPSW